MPTLNRAGFNALHFNALGFEQAQRKQGFTDQNGQGFASTGTAAQHLNRFTSDETNLTQATQSGIADLGGAAKYTLNQSVRAIRKLR
jgi:hypothetical protein